MGHKNVRYISSMSNRDQGGGVKKQGLPSTVGKSGLLTMSIRRRASNNFKTTEPVSESISGTINDGPVSGATVKLIDAQTNIQIAETETNTLGRYNFNVSELPDTFRIETIEGKGTDTITRETTKIPKLSGIFRKNINDLNNANVNIVTTLVSDMVTNENLTIDNATAKVKQLSGDENLDIYNDFISNKDTSLLLLNQRLFFMYNINKASNTSELAKKLSELTTVSIVELATKYLPTDEQKNIFTELNNLTTYNTDTSSFITIVEDSYKLTEVSKDLEVQPGEIIADVIQKEKFKIKLNRIDEASLKELRLTDSTKFTANGQNNNYDIVYSLSNNAIILQSEKLVIADNEVLVIDNNKGIVGRSGYIENNGTIIIKNKGELVAQNTGKFIVNNGTIYLTDNNSKITTEYNDTIENNTGGVINIIENAKINFTSIEGTIINFGTINNNGSLISKTSIVKKTIVNYGTFNNYAGGNLIYDSATHPLEGDTVFNIDNGELKNIVLSSFVDAFISRIQGEISNKTSVVSSDYYE
jgi:hypothetical protein